MIKTVREVCQCIGGVVDRSPICVETGCTYTYTRESLVHTTTNNIYKYIVRPNKGFLFSLDIDPDHIKTAQGMDDLAFDCAGTFDFWQGDSVQSMFELVSELEEGGEEISVLCLDSKEFDEDHMLNEYKAALPRLAEKHYVLVDDIHNPNSVKHKKTVPELKRRGYFYMEVPTPTGLFIASKIYPLPCH